MRFLADMGIALRVVERLRQQGHDVVHLLDRGLERLPDHAIFEMAALENRILLTFDLDFGEIVALSRGKVVSVVLFRLRNTTSPHLLRRLDAVLKTSEAHLRTGAVVVVEDSRHRIRSLPIGS